MPKPPSTTPTWSPSVKPKKIDEVLKKAIEQKIQDIKPTHRERDMRQEAIDLGAHQANEMFGDKHE